MHDISGIDQAKPNPPADRRGNVAIDEIQFRILHRRLIIAHRAVELIDGRLLGVNLLLRHCAGVLQQVFVALIIQLGVTQRRLIFKQAALAPGRAGPDRGEDR